MKNKTNILIFTFLGVLLSVFGTGFIGITLSLNHMTETYVKLQLDVNKRQAESIAKFLEAELQNGVPQDTVLARLQKSVQGTEVEKGFLCMFDKKGAKLVCHPNKEMVGMDLPSKFTFKQVEKSESLQAADFVKNSQGGGGLLDKDGAVDITYMTPVEGTDWMLSLHENIAMIQAEIRREKIIYATGSIILGLLIAILATLAARFVSRKYEKKIEAQNQELQMLNAELHQQNEEILTQKEHISNQKEEIEKQKEEITDSIKYAERIQFALLPPKQNLSQVFDEHFLLFQPRDIVSGDFYWLAQTGDKSIIAVADCTGHGVPGAFMSMLGIAFLNEISSKNENITAAEILEQLKEKVIISLRQKEKHGESKDGMDITICVLDKNKKNLQFSGANNPIVQISNNKLTEHKGDRMPAGIYYGKKDKKFTNIDIDYIPNDQFYMFSDGYPDQFGGKDLKKFMKKNFKNLLLENNQKPMSEQKTILQKTLTSWIGSYKQIDDIIVLGFKL